MAEGAEGAVIEVTLPARPSFLSLARIVVASVASIGPSLQDSRLADLRLIVSELYTNAMEANWRATKARLVADGDGTEPNHEAVLQASPPVQVRCRVELHAVEVTVSDSGTGFAPDDDPHPPVRDPGRLDFEHGLGIPLVQFLADEVDYTSSDAGTVVRALIRDGDRGRSVN